MPAFPRRSPRPAASPDHGPARRRRARAWLVGLLPAAALLWAVAGYASVSFLDTLRLMATNDIGGWGDGTAGLVGGPTLFFAAALPASFLGFAVSWQATSAFSTFRAGALLGGAVTSGGTAAGLLAAWLASRWTAPRTVGEMVSEWDGGSADWGLVAWVAYHGPWLLPAGLGSAAAVTLLRLAATHRPGRRAATKAAEIREHGVRMPGTIARVDFTHTWIEGNPRFEVTVTYVGKYGPRQVTQPFVTRPLDAPTPGGQVDVWYDPLGEDGVVLVELTARSSDHRVIPSLFPR
ncbi:hypothetical protein RM844_08910 [Streptomyces sp. DSM 44915]|uniref:DUF3592 domain-containing protein n=1 Tax=Streptomyces chisholmiae TaxID=3075540 RepID=A0ABU2JN48_9ACTN|nr:hypothetical protein [Streptomyces sp. DSM 44915]MDT0266415.1 hypothetical protein [Streptomyces sp. DSM 44915]